MSVPAPLLDLVGNLARHHREHEKHYAGASLETAAKLQRVSRTLQALPEHWRQAEPAVAASHFLSQAMDAGWGMAKALLDFPELADMLGERHAIVAAADLSAQSAVAVHRNEHRWRVFGERITSLSEAA